ncbi:hypothetical protein Hanom_Chr07g00645371 [Helianthus anomalus]
MILLVNDSSCALFLKYFIVFLSFLRKLNVLSYLKTEFVNYICILFCKKNDHLIHTLRILFIHPFPLACSHRILRSYLRVDSIDNKSKRLVG